MEFEKLCEIIAEVMNVNQEDLTPETKFVDDLGADSLDIFKISMGMEEIFDMEFDGDELEKAETIEEVVSIICRRD
jgi:acyl carrier protein